MELMLHFEALIALTLPLMLGLTTTAYALYVSRSARPSTTVETRSVTHGSYIAPASLKPEYSAWTLPI